MIILSVIARAQYRLSRPNNTYITNKTVNGFTLTFKVGDNSTVVDSPSILCDHSISIMGVSANQIDTTSNTIPQLGQTNIFPTGFNLA